MINQTLKGRYFIKKELSHGGFGQTYIAEDRGIQNIRPCVIKHLKPQATDPLTIREARRLFNVEQQSLQRVGKHPQIPEFFDYFEENQEFYLVQELIEGHSLSDELTGEKWTEDRVIKLLQDILEPLSFVHQNNIIHRDIKPPNLIRRNSDQKLVLIDFGAVKQIATQFVNSQGQSRMTVPIGTEGYMPLEQRVGHPKFSSDLYAVGVIAIQALLGCHNPQKLINENLKLVWKNQVDISKELVNISEELVNILDRMTESEWKKRPQNAGEVLQLLKPLINQQLMECPICFRENAPGTLICLGCGYVLNANSTIFSQPTVSVFHLQPHSLLKQGVYQIEKTLGEGGFGVTYRAIYTPNKAIVAIKELTPEKYNRQGNTILWGDSISAQEKQQQINKFKIEAANQQKCNHPHIPKIYDCFEENDTVYIAMEFITGKSLSKILKAEGILTEERVKKYAIEVAQALKIIHQNNFLHRDIKPDNIIINQQDQAILIDFGAAKEFIAGQTRLMTQILTKGYAPLEQYSQNSKRYPASDIYALCASLYELLTGELPVEAVERIHTDSLISPRQINPKISLLMETVILTGMRMKVEERWQTAEDFINALEKGIIISPLHQKAREYVKNYQLPEAIQCYEKCLVTEPNNQAIPIELALVEIHVNHNKAEIYAEKALDFNPNEGRAYGVLGLVKCRQQKWQEAVNTLQKAVSLAPHELWIKANLAWALGKIQNWSQAETMVNQVLQIDNNCAFALGVKSWIALNQKQWQIAVGSATKVVLLSQQNPCHYHQELQKWVYPCLVYAFDQGPKLNQNSQEIENKRLEDFIQNFPQESFAWGFKGWKLAKNADYHNAIICLQKVINQPNLDSWILFNYAIIHEYTNRIQEAINIYQNHPNHSFSLFRLGTLLAKQGQWQNAKNHLEKAIQLKPDFAEAYHNLAWVLLNFKNADGTVIYHQELLDNYRQAINYYYQHNQSNYAKKIEQTFQSLGLTI